MLYYIILCFIILYYFIYIIYTFCFYHHPLDFFQHLLKFHLPVSHSGEVSPSFLRWKVPGVDVVGERLRRSFSLLSLPETIAIGSMGLVYPCIYGIFTYMNG